MTFPFPFFIPAVTVPVAISHVANASSGSDLTTYTFASQSFGGTAADRLIVVCIVSRATALRAVTGVTIGGITASQIVNDSGPNSGGVSNAAIYAALVPTGASGDVVVTHSAANARCAISVYRLTGAPGGLATGAFSSSNNPSASINVPAGGVALAMGLSATGTSATWSGLDEDVDTTVESQSYSSAHLAFVNAANSHAIQCTWGSNATPAFAYAVFSPG